jgi:hypothetical protein
VPNQGGVFEVVFLEEGLDVFCEGQIVVRLIVGRVAVVARVDCVDRAGEVASEDAGAVREEGAAAVREIRTC